MATWKVAYFSGVGGRPATMLENAPNDIEVTVVDPALPESEKSNFAATPTPSLPATSAPTCSRNAPG